MVLCKNFYEGVNKMFLNLNEKTLNFFLRNRNKFLEHIDISSPMKFHYTLGNGNIFNSYHKPKRNFNLFYTQSRIQCIHDRDESHLRILYCRPLIKQQYTFIDSIKKMWRKNCLEMFTSRKTVKVS